MAKKPKRIELSDKANDKSYGKADHVIDGNGGDDSISGGGGNDKILGGDGNDFLRGGTGDDRLSGQAGDDRISGGEGDDSITAGIGNDTVDGGAGDDLVKLTGKFADATVEKDGESYVITVGTAVTTVKNVETFKFEDGTFDVKDLEDKVSGSTGNTFTLTTLSGENFPGTTGDDTFNAVIDATDQTLNAFDIVSGGSGNDKMNLVVDDTFAVPAGASISDIETILISTEAAAAGDIDVKAFKGATLVAQSGAVALDFIEVADGQTVKFGDGVANVAYLDAAKAATIELDKVTSGGTIDVEGLGLTSLKITGSVDEAAPGVAGSLQIDNVEDDPLTVADEGSNIATLTLGLTSDTDVDIDNLLGFDSVDFKTLDASSSTGDLTFDSFEDDNYLTSIKLGSGDDYVHYDTDYTNGGDGGLTVTIDAGAGNDEVELQLYTNTVATKLTVTLGAGSDTVFLTDGNFETIVTASAAGVDASLVSIADFKASEDVFDLSNLGLVRDTLTNAQLTTIEGSASLFAAANAAAALIANDFVVFDFGGNAYILYDGDASGDVSADDGLVELVGTSAVDLTASNFIV